VVLQSDPAKLSEELTSDAFPFEIICDPEQTLYREFAVTPAKSRKDMGDAKTMEKLAQAKLSGFKHGEDEGNGLQLPATFVVTPDLMIVYAHYGKSAGDVPTPVELAKLLM